MSLISATDLAKSYGLIDIFAGISLSIPRGARIAIVGPNGIGKTTLLRLLVGLEEPSAGRLHRARRLSIGYLPQEAGLDTSLSLWKVCLTAVAHLQSQEEELAYLERAMADPDKADEVLKRYGKLQEAFERDGGYTYEARIRQVLTGLGFKPFDFERPIPQLSGGQRTRALLARLLLTDPDLLILDEPTNHLDIAAVEWLEGYLSQWEGTALVVSHDRYFLDKVVDHIWEMGVAGIEVYRSNYSAYVQQRQERWELRNKIFQSEQARLLKEIDYVKRNIAGQRTTHARGKLRRLSREVQAIDSLGLDAIQGKSWAEVSSKAEISEHTLGIAEVESRIKGLKGPRNRPPQLSLNLKSTHRSGDLVLRTKDLEIGYQDDGKTLFRAPDLLLKRGECAAVVGPNGAGKTTIRETLLEKLPPLKGEVILGASLRIGYFAQAHEDLRPERTLVEEIEAVAPNLLLADIRHYLARFLFTGDQVFARVSTLSGGERGRLALAKLSLTKANLLLLDEPTNHLDIPSQEILQEVLADYKGTMLLVSHDRYLIDALGSQIWEIQTGRAALSVFIGTYSQYHEFLDQEGAQDYDTSKVDHKTRKDQKRSINLNQKLDRRRRARLKEVEGLIVSLEAQEFVLAQTLEKPPADPTKVQKLGQDYVRVQDELNKLLIEWEELGD